MDFEKAIKEDRESLIEDLVKLVSINSVEGSPKEGMPFGEGAAKALQCYLELARAAGFRTENFDSYAGHAEIGEGDETLGILGHVDVVPCGEGWICDPFQPQIIDGKLYGRGVLDNKGPMVVCLHAVKILKDMGIPLRKKIRLIVGANEETDWKCMEYYFGVKNITPPDISFTPDAEFPLNHAEKGVFQYQIVTDLREDLHLFGGNAYNSVAEFATVLLPFPKEAEVKERIACWEKETNCTIACRKEEQGLRLDVRGKAAHAANPSGGINAVSGLMKILKDLELQGELGEIADWYMAQIGFDLTGKRLGIHLADDISGALSLNVGKVEIKEKQLIFSMDSRVPVTYKCSDVRQLLEKQLEGTRFRLENPQMTEAIYIPKDTFLVKTLMEVYREVTGDREAEPKVDGACSYARALQNCVAFGAILPGQPDLMHQKNEYLELDKLDLWMKIYLEAIYRLAK